MTTKSSDAWNAIFPDTVYAGGGANGGAPSALDQNALVQGTDTLVAVDDQIAVTYPTAIPEREAQKGLGAGLYANAMNTTKIPPGQGHIDCWFQDDNWYDLAISGTFGNLMSTFTWHTDNGEEELDHFGCWVSKLVITFEAGKPTLQSVDIKSRSWGAGNAMTKVAFTATEKFGSDNINKTTTTIDSKLASALVINKIVLTIENTVEEQKSYALGDTELAIQLPVLIARDVSVEVWHFQEDSNTWAADARNKTAQLVNIDIVPFTGELFNLDNLYVLATNTDEIAHGMKQHYAKFKDGVGFAIA